MEGEKSLILKKLEETGLVTYQEIHLDGLENVTPSDILTPVYSLIQPTSDGASKVNEGRFVDQGSGETQDEITCILTGLKKTRSLWPKPFNPGDERICFSNNGLVPSEDAPNKQSSECVKIDKGIEIPICDKSQFGPRGGAPECSMIYTLFGFDIAKKLPFIISLKGKSVHQIKQLINVFLRKQKNLWEGITTIKTSRPENLGMAKGNYFIAIFEIKWAEDESERRILEKVFKMVTSRTQQEKEPSSSAEEGVPF